MNGTGFKHGKTIGYIVSYPGTRVGTLCYGYTDSRNKILLAGNPVTLFRTRRQATAAIRGTIKDDPDRGPIEQYSVLRVAEVEEARHA